MKNPRAQGGFQDHPENINRQGRPKKGVTFTDVIEEYGKTKEKGKTLKENLVETLWRKALDGDFYSLKYLMDRCDGTPKATVETINHVDESWGAVLKYLIENSEDIPE